MKPFVHLHVHSHFSILDGLGKPKEMVNWVAEMNSPALAITDHASISSLPALFKECKEAEIKPIIGCEFYVVNDPVGNKDEKRFHMTVWAKTWKGVQSIMSKLTVANEQFYKRPRITFHQAMTFEDCCIGTACAIGVVSHPNHEALVDVFVKKYGDDFYFEMMPIDFTEQRVVNSRILDLREKYPSTKIIITNDAHYVKKEDSIVHDTLLAIQTNASLSNPDRFTFGSDEFYMRSYDEMREAMLDKHPYVPIELVCAALDETVNLANKCNVILPEFPITLPSPYDVDDLEIFASKLKNGWEEKIPLIEKHGKHSQREYMDRLMFEIDVIKKKGFVRYFLVVEDMITWARNNGIMVGPARGSSAGSLVCWLMGITQVDPLRWGLYFERFLDIEREDYPDIDVDFQDDQRHRVFEYVRDKYGHDKTSQITTFGFLKPKSAFRDVCRVNDRDMSMVNFLSKKIEDVGSFEEDPELVSFAKKNPLIIETAKSLCGTIRSQGCHAAGIVVSSRPLTDVCVVEKRSGSDVCNWDKRECEKFGLIKIDALGLSTLSVLARAKELIAKTKGVDVVFEDIEFDNDEVLKLFKNGETVGIFQFESPQMRNLLKSINPKNFRAVVDCTALFRPGSLGSGQTDKYVSIAKGDEYETYAFPELKPILQDTHSVLVFQEQIMQIFNKIGGFTWAEANKMRKIIGKKLGADEFEKHRTHFVDGCIKNGVNATQADRLFTDMVSFAEYSFNLSHAVAYTAISWWCGYLKTYYPVEYFAAVLECSTKTDLVPVYIRECNNFGIEVRLPDINISTNRYEVNTDSPNGAIVAPLGIVKNVGGKAVDEIMRARSEGVFLSFKNFEDRIIKRSCNVRVVDSLRRAGVFESLGVGTEDQEQRAKDLAELVPIFQQMPSIPFESELPLNKDALSKLYANIFLCAKCGGDKPMLAPYIGGSHPAIMMLNVPQKGEEKNLTKNGTKYLHNLFVSAEVPISSLYYANPFKCAQKDGAKPSKDCVKKCMDFVREEITIVKPKLIVCTSSDHIGMFLSGKNTMRDLHGKVVYNKEFDSYVMFSYSPQYLFYGDDKKPLIDKFVATFRELFHGVASEVEVFEDPIDYEE